MHACLGACVRACMRACVRACKCSSVICLHTCLCVRRCTIVQSCTTILVVPLNRSSHRNHYGSAMQRVRALCRILDRNGNGPGFSVVTNILSINNTSTIPV